MTKTLSRKLTNVALAGAIALGCAGAATTTALVSAGTQPNIAQAVTMWHQSGGSWWYQVDSRHYAIEWWHIGGSWYYFDHNGWMKTGWQYIDGDWYYFNGSGAMATGWQSLNGTWYYFGSDGAMAVGWERVGGTWYYFKSSGAMATGWQTIGGKWYHFNGSGAMSANKWVGNYYLKNDGAMATNSWVDGNKYYVGADGVWIPNYSAPSEAQKPSTTPSAQVNLEGRWKCAQITVTGTGGWMDVPASEQSNNYVNFNTSNKTATFGLNGTLYYADYVFDSIEGDIEYYKVYLDTNETCTLGAHRTNGMLLLILDDDTDSAMLYIR